MGNLGTSRKSIGTEAFKTVAHGAMDMFKQITAAVGIKEDALSKHFVGAGDNKPKADSTLPRDFTWRTEMPECLGMIEDQGDCGSCWAFTSAGLLSDRLCIHTKGRIDVRLSP